MGGPVLAGGPVGGVWRQCRRALGSLSWDGAGVRLAPQGTQLTLRRTSASPSAAGHQSCHRSCLDRSRQAVSTVPSSRSLPGGRGAAGALCPWSAPENSSLAVSSSVPSAGVTWSARRSSLSASSPQVLGALRDEPCVGKRAPVFGVGGAIPGIKSPLEGSGSAGVCALRFEMYGFGGPGGEKRLGLCGGRLCPPQIQSL